MSVLEDPLSFVWADRIGGSNFLTQPPKPYKFEQILKIQQKAQLLKPESKLLDFSLGEPNILPSSLIRNRLICALNVRKNHLYADNEGIAFRQAVSAHMKSVYNVNFNTETEIVHSMGIKSALALLAGCFINPGDQVVITTPGYPVFGTQTRYYGGYVHTIHLYAENQFLPDLDVLTAEVWQQIKVLVLNYPNNPTGAIATREFFQKAVKYALKYNFIIIQDAAYSLMTFDTKPLSIFNIPDAKLCAIEVHSLSKAFHMTGWRLGWVCGNTSFMKAYSLIKSNTDSGQFLAIQEAGCEALKNASKDSQMEVYRRRFSLLINILSKHGFSANMPAAGFFIYVLAPKVIELVDGTQVSIASAESFSQWLVRELLISTVSWDEAGAFIRFAVTYIADTVDQENELMQILDMRLKTVKFIFE